jgi:RNA-binding protein
MAHLMTSADNSATTGTPMPISLSPRQRQHLKALAHGLSPVVQVGAAGVSDAVVAAMHEALKRH